MYFCSSFWPFTLSNSFLRFYPVNIIFDEFNLKTLAMLNCEAGHRESHLLTIFNKIFTDDIKKCDIFLVCVAMGTGGDKYLCATVKIIMQSMNCFDGRMATRPCGDFI